jgi:hypothetical protein
MQQLGYGLLKFSVFSILKRQYVLGMVETIRTRWSLAVYNLKNLVKFAGHWKKLCPFSYKSQLLNDAKESKFQLEPQLVFGSAPQNKTRIRGWQISLVLVASLSVRNPETASIMGSSCPASLNIWHIEPFTCYPMRIVLTGLCPI